MHDDSLRLAIRDGDIRYGSRMLASRALAEQLGVARHSVLYADERVSGEGFRHRESARFHRQDGERRECGGGVG
ncbi:hypothetical protein [Paraburkholderia dipogonis]|uniref:hypothetical protein n=1 Tax=Paraburkholderia dipogonis TaxID=1211383 RepID=UPI0038BDA309